MKRTIGVVYTVKINSYTSDSFLSFLRKIESLFSIRNNSIICIKPNICLMKKANTGVTTDLVMVSEIIKFITERWNVETNIVESDATVNNIDVAYRALGYEKMARNQNVNLVNLSKEEKVALKIGGTIKKIEFPRILLECDFFISIPKLKTHEFTTISCALKNQFGCISDPKKSKYHKVISEVIANVNKIMRQKPSLYIVDGLMALEGPGPIVGRPVKMGMTLAGTDPVAVDVACAGLIGFDYKKIEHIMASQKIGAGTTKVKIIGDFPRRKFSHLTMLDKITRKFMSLTRRN